MNGLGVMYIYRDVKKCGDAEMVKSVVYFEIIIRIFC